MPQIVKADIIEPSGGPQHEPIRLKFIGTGFGVATAEDGIVMQMYYGGRFALIAASLKYRDGTG